MPSDRRETLAAIKRIDQLVAYLRDELDWPIGHDSFEDLTFDYSPEELGIDAKNAAKIQEIKRLRPLTDNQPWGIFFVKFEPKRLPVVALRRILNSVVIKKVAVAKTAGHKAWSADDLLFVSDYGLGEERRISLAHFSAPAGKNDLPTLRVLGWDNLDTTLRLDAVARELREHLSWPKDESDARTWREQWGGAFTLRHREVVTTSKQLSIRLAALARSIRDRIKAALAIETEKGPLTQLMKAFQTSLVHDLDADGFADMYAQTIAYGLLSARIADPHKKTADDFSAHMRTNPFLRELMETFLKVGGRRGKAGGPGIDFDELGVSEVVELLDDANMEAVVRDFGDKNPQEDPVIHFYELFLKEYDAKKRMQRGVFYTPRPVVSYIVRAVDELLRTEFGLADGLADTTTWGEMAKLHKDLKIPEGVSPDQDFVQILDPATGTGTFLVEVIDLVHKTLVAKWKAQGHGERKIDTLWNEYVPRHLLTRLHGYELLMAPYAIAHLKIGLKLYETGYRFGSDERARVYLTNALEPAEDFSGRFEFAIPALAHEAREVNNIKRHKRFTAITGNPPYAGHSANPSIGEDGRLTHIGRMIEDYKYVEGIPLGEQNPKYLHDDYVKFIRLSESLLSATGVGLLGFITNHGYLENPTFRGMRWRLTTSFEQASILDLHGDSMKRETDLQGGKDENVFDIQQGVAIAILTKAASRAGCRVQRGDLWGVRSKKYKFLDESALCSTAWTELSPGSPDYLFLIQDSRLKAEYEAGWRIPDVMPFGSTGIKTHRDHFVLDHEIEQLKGRIADFRDLTIPDAELRATYGLQDTRDWKLAFQRKEFAKVKDWQASLTQVLYRPFDWRAYAGHENLVELPRAEVMQHLVQPGSRALLVNRQIRVDRVQHFLVSSSPVDFHVLETAHAAVYVYPLHLRAGESRLGLSVGDRINLSRAFLGALAAALRLPTRGAHGLPESMTAEDIFHYAYAVFHSPTYRSRYAEFLKRDFPRLPLTGELDLFRALSRLGGELVALHLLESRKVDQTFTEFLGGRAPEIGKVSWSNNTIWIDKAQTTGFKGVREEVWSFHIGGYQVCEKWLKDRKGRTLSKDDIAHYQKIIVALSETIRLMKEIDEVIEQHGGWPGAFQTNYDVAERPLLMVAEDQAPFGNKPET